MFNNRYDGIRIGDGNRSVTGVVQNGRVTISGLPYEKCDKCIVTIKNRRVNDVKELLDGHVVYHLAYGKFEKEGKNIIRFHKEACGRHGKARREDVLFGHKGVCHSWFSHGRLTRQKFIYDNRIVAYYYTSGKKEFVVRDHRGQPLYEITGQIKTEGSMLKGARSVFNEDMDSWFFVSKPFSVKKNGKEYYSGAMENRQKVGRWVEDGKVYYYQKGLQIPEKLYNTPPDKLDPMKILKLGNAQLRMALMSKIDPKKMAKCGTVIHKEGDMLLYNIPKIDTRILRVRCTTTKAYYYLRVPKDSTKCEQARQWTFGVGETFNAPIKFEVET